VDELVTLQETVTQLHLLNAVPLAMTIQIQNLNLTLTLTANGNATIVRARLVPSWIALTMRNAVSVELRMYVTDVVAIATTHQTVMHLVMLMDHC